MISIYIMVQLDNGEGLILANYHELFLVIFLIINPMKTTYFKNCQTIDEVKKLYKNLAHVNQSSLQNIKSPLDLL